MKPTLAQIRTIFTFSIALSAITVIANLFIYATTGTENGAVFVFLCFLPMVFWHVSYGQRRLLEYTESLEQRLKAIEQRATGAA